jgi:hypothetical protein
MEEDSVTEGEMSGVFSLVTSEGVDADSEYIVAGGGGGGAFFLTDGVDDIGEDGTACLPCWYFLGIGGSNPTNAPPCCLI